jgi:hypothetical protein
MLCSKPVPSKPEANPASLEVSPKFHGLALGSNARCRTKPAADEKQPRWRPAARK